MTQDECTAANGIDFEVGVTCAEKDCDVPCCVPDDPCCIKVSLDECVAQNGIAGPVGVSCEDYECPPQACCFDDGSCQDLTCEECVALGGRTQGFGSSCATTICCDGAIGDFIWLDNSFAGSCNGKQDAGEPGIAGVVVTLYRQLADGSLEFVQQTVTNSSGHYLFSGPDICAGDYCVEVQTPMGLYPTTPFAGNDPAKDSDCFNGLACLTLPTSVSEDLTIDCGFCMPEDCCEPDKPKALTFRYTGEDCSATDNTQGDGDDCDDFGNLPDTVYIVAGKQSDCDNNADETYFEGTVSVGEDFTIARPDGGDFASNTYFCIYNSQGGQLKQTIKIHTSCSKDLISGQQFGSLILISCGGAGGGNFDCDGKIVQMSMIWNGTQAVTIKAWDGAVGSTLIGNFGPLNPGDEVTVGPLNGPNDSIWEIFSAASGQKIGESKFHRSCSDSDMNGPEDCGKAEGNGKQNDSNFLNLWILNGLVDEAGQVLDCGLAGPPGPSPLTFEQTITGGNNDVEEKVSGSMYLDSTDLELAFDDWAPSDVVGLRYTNVNIPQGAVIENAYVQFKVDEVSTGAVSLTINYETVDNASAFTSSNFNLTSRPTSTTSVTWSPPAWNSVGLAGPDQRSPSLASLVQEIVNRPGWSSGNALVLIITGDGTRAAEAYEGDAAGAARLHVEWSTP